MVAAVVKNRKSIRAEWSRELSHLVAEMAEWAREAGWLVHETKVPIEEDSVGKYVAPGLQIKPPVGHFFVEPLGRDVLGAEGRIDLYAWPTMHRLKLIRKDGAWRLRDDFGKPWPKRWSRKAFLDVVQELTSKR